MQCNNAILLIIAQERYTLQGAAYSGKRRCMTGDLWKFTD